MLPFQNKAPSTQKVAGIARPLPNLLSHTLDYNNINQVGLPPRLSCCPVKRHIWGDCAPNLSRIGTNGTGARSATVELQSRDNCTAGQWSQYCRSPSPAALHSRRSPANSSSSAIGERTEQL